MTRTEHQKRHSDRKWMKTLKRDLQLDKRIRESGLLPRLDPKRLPV
jgi:hypothetical protein